MRRSGTFPGRSISRLSGLVLGLLAISLCGWAGPAAAEVPETMTFQGMLTQDEAPVSGSAHLVFAIYAEETGGSALWSQDAGETPVTDGLYSVTLGPLSDLAFDSDYWLEVTVDGVPMTPRYALHSVPYALRAASADAVAAGSVDGAAVADGSLTVADLGNDVVSSISGVANDGGDIALVAGEHITITPDDANNSITISAGDGLGEVNAVLGGGGLTAENSEGPQVSLSVGAGSGIEVTPDAVQLAGSYLSGSAYDERFVNAGETDAVTAAMIAPDIVSSISGVRNDGGTITLVAGPNVTITTDDESNTITITAADGEGGDITDVLAGDGLTALSPEGPQVTLGVGAGDGIIVADDAIAVNAGTGLRLTNGQVALASNVLAGEIYDSRFVNSDEANAVTTEMVVPDVVSSISGVSNDGGNVALIAGPNVTITPDDEANSVTIGALGDVTDVIAGPGISVEEPGGPEATVSVNAGHGLLAADEGLFVDTVVLAGDGLRRDAENNFSVTPGTGLEISEDQVQLTEPYSSGSVYDDRFVNEAQEDGVTIGMIADDVIENFDGRYVNEGQDVSLDPNMISDALNEILDDRYVNEAQEDGVTIGMIADDVFTGFDNRYVNEEGPGTIPVGGIIMWSGVSVPSGWALCNGQTVNGHTTPDLRNRFVVASGGSYSIGSTGGESSHTLTIDEMPSHNHSISDPGHSHVYWNPTYGEYRGMDYDESGTAVEYPWQSSTNTAATGISINSRGGGVAHNNMPPYYGLAFIMRVQ